MQPLNYCRNLVKQAKDILASPSLSAVDRANYQHLIDLAHASQKFILPPGGIPLQDNEFRAIDESLELSLPYSFVALEFETLGGPTYPDEVTSSRRIIFARQRDDFIFFTTVAKRDADGVWMFTKEAAIPRVNYLTRSPTNGCAVGLNMYSELGGDEQTAGILMSFLNALSCSNVRAERVAARRSKVKAALPFDEYHALTVGGCGITSTGATTGGHRSPREHLRRGHIRRYESGLKVWVNATVVNAGVGGKVTKDYRVAA
jgi:hypothetical protein